MCTVGQTKICSVMLVIAAAVEIDSIRKARKSNWGRLKAW
jgi:hypothetical protein